MTLFDIIMIKCLEEKLFPISGLLSQHLIAGSVKLKTMNQNFVAKAMVVNLLLLIFSLWVPLIVCSLFLFFPGEYSVSNDVQSIDERKC